LEPGDTEREDELSTYKKFPEGKIRGPVTFKKKKILWKSPFQVEGDMKGERISKMWEV